MYKIEKNVPLPDGCIKRKTKYRFAQMKRGDSFLSKERKVIGAAHAHAKKYKKKFVCRSVGKRVRVWRAA